MPIVGRRRDRERDYIVLCIVAGAPVARGNTRQMLLGDGLARQRQALTVLQRRHLRQVPLGIDISGWLHR